MKRKISTGWFFIIFQIVGYICAIITNNPIKFNNIPYFIGYNLFAIIGIVMVTLDIADKSDKKDETINKMKEYKYETNIDIKKDADIDFKNMDKSKKLELYYYLNTTLESAKKDLTTGVKKEELEYYYKNNFLSQEDYINTINAINSLEMIVNLYSPTIEQLKNEIELEDEKQEIKNEEKSQINDTSSTAQDIVQQSNKKKIENENNTFSKILSVILGIFLSISIIIIFSLLIKNEKQRLKIIELEDTISSLKSNNTFYKNLLEEIQNKIDFYDEYIVIIPQDSDYYMNYDCWNQKGRSNTFKIMNYKEAQNNGYKEYTCNIRERLGLSQ